MKEDDDRNQSLPEHMTLMSVAARGYKHYIGQLKKGSKSGISGVFGSADDLLPPASPKPTPLLADPSLAPANDIELDKRSRYLAQLSFNQSRLFLQEVLAKFATAKTDQNRPAAPSASEALEASASGSATVAIDSAGSRNATKQLTCVSIYLTMLDQGREPSAPEWLLDLFGSALGATDSIIATPDARSILATHTTQSNYEACNTLPQVICKHLQLKDPYAERFVHEYLFNSGSVRRDLLRKSLEDDWQTIAACLSRRTAPCAERTNL